jgi:transcriptional regulator
VALLKGTLDLLVLKALSLGTKHGFEITQWIEAGSEGEIPVEAAALLQALHRLEERGLVTGEWGITENKRRARYYALTAGGKSYLKAETESLKSSVAALATLLDFRAVPPRGGR